MACWMIHLRIAEKLMDKYKYSELEPHSFIVGNIAPDSGELNEDKISYNPPKHISHWQDINQNKASRKDDFFREYFTEGTDIAKLSFYLGYYVHLFTDVLWKEKILYPTREKYLTLFTDSLKFSQAIKKDWYQVDVLFIRENPSFYPYEILRNTDTFPNVYLDYFTPTAIEHKIKEIVETYLDPVIDEDYDYPYLNTQTADEFVDFAVEKISTDVVNKIAQMAFKKLAEVMKNHLEL